MYTPVVTRAARIGAVLVGVLFLGCNERPAPQPSQSDATLTTGFVEVEGGRLYYEELGTGDPVVLVHSSGTDRRLWDARFACGRHLDRAAESQSVRQPLDRVAMAKDPSELSLRPDFPLRGVLS